MVRPNYRTFRMNALRSSNGFSSDVEHSAKGSTWEEHKYIKRIDGTYYYPDNYVGGRHLPDGDDQKNDSDEDDKENEDNKNYKNGGELNKRVYEDLMSGKLKVDERVKNYDDFVKMMEDTYGIDASDYRRIDLKNIQKGLNNGIDPDEEGPTLTDNDVENLAREVIRGNFGVGQVRKDLLGENYRRIQSRVNELMKGSTGSIPVSQASEESIQIAQTAARQASSRTNVHSGVNMDEVMRVYR